VFDRAYSDAEIDAAVQALGDPQRMADTRDRVALLAPRLQPILAEALQQGGWFGEAHETGIARAVRDADERERCSAVRTLLAEETRLGMLVGVAVGIELVRELQGSRGQPTSKGV